MKKILRGLPQITSSSCFHFSAIFDFFSIANLSPYLDMPQYLLNRKNKILRKNETNLEEVIYGRPLNIFLVSFLFNLIWENLHSVLYIGYQGGKITEFILMRASLGDAVMITVLLLPFLYIVWFQKRGYLIVVAGIVLAILIEWYALSTGRWAYNEYMPIIPFLNIGLTPTIQLGLLGYLTFWITERKRSVLIR